MLMIWVCDQHKRAATHWHDGQITSRGRNAVKRNLSRVPDAAHHHKRVSRMASRIGNAPRRHWTKFQGNMPGSTSFIRGLDANQFLMHASRVAPVATTQRTFRPAR
jgi:hypothetical protein